MPAKNVAIANMKDPIAKAMFTFVRDLLKTNIVTITNKKLKAKMG